MMLKFEKEVEALNGRSTTMGTEQYLLQKVEHQGLEKGKHEEAITIARENKYDSIPVAQISKFTKLSIEEIDKL